MSLTLLLEIITGLSGLIVAVIYLVLGLLLVPGLRANISTTIYASVFFVGCAGSHTHWGADLITGLPPEHGVWVSLVLHLMQIVGGVGFAYDIHTKRMTLRVPDDLTGGKDVK